MEESLRSRIDKMLDLYDIIKKEYRWNNSLVNRFAALNHSLKKTEFNRESYDTLMKYIKNRTSAFSHYRNYHLFMIASMLITEFKNPASAFDDMLLIELKLKEVGFRKNNYASLAAFTIMRSAPEGYWDNMVGKSYCLYKSMKENHFWLTSAEDYPVAALLSCSEKELEYTANDIEACYERLVKEGFSRSNGLQFLSHVLTLIDKDLEERISKVVTIFNHLKANDIKVPSSSYSVLGLLALFGEYSIEAADNLIEIYNYLRVQKGFKWNAKGINILFASALVSSDYMIKAQAQGIIGTTLSTSIEALIAAQMAATAAAVSSSAAAASAGSS